MEQLEDVVDADAGFDVGCASHDVAGGQAVAHGEEEKVGVMTLVGVVLVRQGAPQAADAEHFAPLQFLDEGDAVEELPVHVVAEVERGVAVVQELHVVDEVERLVVLRDVREVGHGQVEQREGDGVPLRSGAGGDVELAPRAEPEALAQADFREVEVVFAAQHAFHADGVREQERGRVERHGHAALLGVDERLAGGVAQRHAQLGGGDVAHGGVLPVPRAGRGAVVAQVLQHAGGLVVAVARHRLDGEARVGLQLVGQGGVAHIRHLVDGGPLPADEHIVLVRGEVLVHGRHHVVGVLEGEVVLGKLPKDVLALVERVGRLSGVEPLPVARAVGAVSAEAPVGMQVAGGHAAQAEAGAVDVVARYHGVDGADVYLAGVLPGAGLHEVLDERLGAEDDVLEAGYLLDAVHEHVHVALFLGEGHLAHLGPVFVALGEHIGFLDDAPLEAEEAGLYLVETVLGVLGGALHLQPLYAFHEAQFDGHVVVGEHPVAVSQLLELLHDVEVLHEVDAGLLGEVHHRLLHGVGGVFHHVEVSGEAEVLRVLRHEGEVHALAAVHHERVHEVELVEADGPASDGADEASLQQAYVVIVDVDVGEDVGQYRAQHIAGVEELFDAGGVDAFDDGLLALGVFAVDGLAAGLLDGDGQYGLAGLGRCLHLVFEEGEFLVDAFLHLLGSDVVERHLHLLVFLVLVVVVLLELQGALVLDDFLHELHGGVVLARVFLFLRFDDDLGEHHVGGRQLHVEPLGAGCEAHFLGDVSDGGEGEFVPALACLHGIFAFGVGDASYAFAFILHGDVHQWLVCERVGYHALYLCRHAAVAGEHGKQQEDAAYVSLFHNLHDGSVCKVNKLRHMNVCGEEKSCFYARFFGFAGVGFTGVRGVITLLGVKGVRGVITSLGVKADTLVYDIVMPLQEYWL